VSNRHGAPQEQTQRRLKGATWPTLSLRDAQTRNTENRPGLESCRADHADRGEKSGAGMPFLYCKTKANHSSRTWERGEAEALKGEGSISCDGESHRPLCIGGEGKIILGDIKG